MEMKKVKINVCLYEVEGKSLNREEIGGWEVVAGLTAHKRIQKVILVGATGRQIIFSNKLWSVSHNVSGCKVVDIPDYEKVYSAVKRLKSFVDKLDWTVSGEVIKKNKEYVDTLRRWRDDWDTAGTIPQTLSEGNKALAVQGR